MDVALYGGFAGTELTLAARDWQKNKTILSGDLTGNDRPLFANDTENSIHVVTFTSPFPGPSTLLDGVTVTGGYADFDHATSYERDGGGLYLVRTSPVIRNCIVTANRAGSGGGVYA